MKEGVNKYSTIYDIILLYEENKIEDIESIISSMSISIEDISSSYIKAIEWADEAIKVS